MATKMKMVSKGGKMVPAFAADGKGKMKMGGTKKPLRKAQDGIADTKPMPTRPMSMVPTINRGKTISTGAPIRGQNDMYKGDFAEPLAPNSTGQFRAPERGQGYKGVMGKKGVIVKKIKNMTTKKMYKTGGMVNANANLVAAKSAGSKGVKAGVNPKAAASNTAKKPAKPRSKAPKKATPGRG